MKQYNINNDGMVSAGLIERIDHFLMALAASLVPEPRLNQHLDLEKALHYLNLLLREVSPMMDEGLVTKMMTELQELRDVVIGALVVRDKQREGQKSIPYSVVNAVYEYDIKLRRVIFGLGLYVPLVHNDGGGC